MPGSFRGAPFVIIALVLAAGACSDTPPGGANEEDPSLKRALSEVRGNYAWRDDLRRYLYSEKLRLEEILSLRPPRDALAELVECLDDTAPSESMLAGMKLAVGIVCYEALTQLVYHEPTAPNGDVAESWPGQISPQASPQELHDAKAAWQRVVNEKLFVFQ
jgi:hypothetical protein